MAYIEGIAPPDLGSVSAGRKDFMKGDVEMEEDQNLDRDHDVFSSKRLEDIIIFRFKENLLFRSTDLRAKAAVLNYLNRVSENDSIKVVIVMGSPQETVLREYVLFYRQALESGFNHSPIQRMYNALMALYSDKFYPPEVG